MTSMSRADLSDDLSVDAIEFRQRIRSGEQVDELDCESSEYLKAQLDPGLLKCLEAGVE